jgi:hypothetical protein
MPLSKAVLAAAAMRRRQFDAEPPGPDPLGTLRLNPPDAKTLAFGTDITVTFTETPALAGDLLVGIFGQNGTAENAIPTDNLSNEVWRKAIWTSQTRAAGASQVGIYYKVAEGGETDVTFVRSDGAPMVAAVYQIAGGAAGWGANPLGNVDGVPTYWNVGQPWPDAGDMAGPGLIITTYMLRYVGYEYLVLQIPANIHTEIWSNTDLEASGLFGVGSAMKIITAGMETDEHRTPVISSIGPYTPYPAIYQQVQFLEA